MLPALYDEDRRALVRLATMLITGALCVLPLTAQTSAVAGAASVHDVTDDARLVPPARLTFPGYEIRRDPFVPEGSLRTTLDGGGVMAAGQGADIGVILPPNAGATQSASIPTVPVIGSVVRAIVLGNPPRALIEAGGMVRVVGVGDRLGELVVVSISSGRVTLSDGSSLTLDGSRK